MPKKKPDWDKIRTEYETTKTSYRKLSEKYDVPFPTIRDRAKRENWQARAQKTRHKIAEGIVTRTSQKIIEKTSEKLATEFELELEAANLIAKIALDALKDEGQFTRHIVKLRTGRGYGVFDEEVIEKDKTVIDAKRLHSIAQALEAASSIKKSLKGFIDPATKAKLDIEREKLEFDKKKAHLGEDEGEETGVVILPEEDYSLLHNAIVEEERTIDTTIVEQEGKADDQSST